MKGTASNGPVLPDNIPPVCIPVINLQRMRMRSVIIPLFLVLCSQTVQAQSYRKMDFNTFSRFLETPGDTLYILNFWATWCKPCLEEIPAFTKLANENPEAKVRVILICLDNSMQWETGLATYLEKNDPGAEVWVLPDNRPADWMAVVDPSWKGSIPATLFFNNARHIRKLVETQLDYKYLESCVTELSAE